MFSVVNTAQPFARSAETTSASSDPASGDSAGALLEGLFGSAHPSVTINEILLHAVTHKANHELLPSCVWL